MTLPDIVYLHCDEPLCAECPKVAYAAGVKAGREEERELYADMFDSYEGKLWSTAVQKCFEAPFVEVAVQFLVRRAYEKGKNETKIDNLLSPKDPEHTTNSPEEGKVN